MKIAKWFWTLTGLGVALQYVYWAAMEIGYGLGLTQAPTVTHDWLFLAFVGAAYASAANVKTEIAALLAPSHT